MIIRREHRRNYTVIANEAAEDARLSYEAFGLLAYLLSKPDDWEVRIDQLRVRGGLGRDKIYRIVGELQSAGYLRHEFSTDKGKVTGGRWIVCEDPAAATGKVEQDSTRGADSEPHPGLTDSGKTGFRKNRSPLNPDADLLLKDTNTGEETSSLRSDVRPPSENRGDLARDAMAIFNDAAVLAGWPLAQRLTPPRQAALIGRLADAGGLEGWRRAMAKARASPFLNGASGRTEGHENWRPDLDFFIRPKVFTKLMEGGYDGRNGTHRDTRKRPHDAILGALAERFAERPGDDRGQAAADGGMPGERGGTGEDRSADR